MTMSASGLGQFQSAELVAAGSAGAAELVAAGSAEAAEYAGYSPASTAQLTLDGLLVLPSSLPCLLPCCVQTHAHLAAHPHSIESLEHPGHLHQKASARQNCNNTLITN